MLAVLYHLSNYNYTDVLCGTTLWPRMSTSLHPGTDSDHSDVQCSVSVEQTCPAGHKYLTSCAQATAAAAQAQRSPGAAAAAVTQK
jgi:hypothetical protein